MAGEWISFAAQQSTVQESLRNMQSYAFIFSFALFAIVSTAAPGYKYSQPLSTIKQNLRSQAPPHNSGLFLNLQSPPLPQLNVQTQNSFPTSSSSSSLSSAVSLGFSGLTNPAALSSSSTSSSVGLPNEPQVPYQLSGSTGAPSLSYLPTASGLESPAFSQTATGALVLPQLQLQQAHSFFSSPQQQAIRYQQPQQQILQSAQRPAIITKDIYIHSAPEEVEDINVSPQLDNVPIRKNYRIIFIKAPTHNLRQTAAALQRVQAANEEKTVIYVLSKRPDFSEIQKQLQITQAEQQVHKPEVYFIKYKTQEEAQRAQEQIQAQYDALGGATHISDEGFAPVTSVSGGGLNLGAIVPRGSSGIQSQNILQPPAQQSIGQQGFQLSSSSSDSLVGSQPSPKYLPVKSLKK